MYTLLILLAITASLPGPSPTPDMPGQAYTPLERPTAEGAPLVYNATLEAGPDESFFMIGENFTEEFAAWGASPDRAGGQEIKLRVQMANEHTVIATLPEKAYDGPVVVWAKNQAGYSEPVVLNTPQPWWCTPETVAIGDELRVFGRNLPHRPDGGRAMVYMNRAGKPGTWIDATVNSKHDLAFSVPSDLSAGPYQLWVHAGSGGAYGWGGPIAVQVQAPPKDERRVVVMEGDDVQEAVDKLARNGGGVLRVSDGVYDLASTLVIPAGVHVTGAGTRQTSLQAPHDPGSLPGADRAAVWLAGDGAGISALTVCGSPRTNLGVAVRSAKWPEWIHKAQVQEVEIIDVEGKQAENCGVRLFNADQAKVSDNRITGRAPLFLSGVTRSDFSNNHLVSVTRFGGNSEAYIVGRNDVVRKCLFESNTFGSPRGAEAGGPTGRRMIWLSTGRGSVDLNWICDNEENSARFGGVAGTDQNVGEMILFEACQRIAYHGQPAAADAQSVTLPKTIPATPDERLGSVKREQLARDAAGNETPFWPPEADDGASEAILSEYFVTVLAGRGMGQTRRVVARAGETYRLEHPWRVAPTPESRILVHTAYWRNHIVDNRAVDGMTGVQLWISCIENVVAGNFVARQRKPGLFLYGNCTTLASSMPCTWNRGIGPLYFNHIEGNRCDETSCGALVTSGEMHRLPIEFPRCLGNVLRHNSLLRNRTDGVLVTGNRTAEDSTPLPAVLGTIVEFNVARDAQVGYRVAPSAEATLLRRNHAYFWYPVNQQPGPAVAFQIDNPTATAVIEQNSVEGIHGVHDGRIIQEQRGPRKEEPKKKP